MAGSFDCMSTLEHRHLRSALEFAVLIATEGQKRRPPLPFPKELKGYLHAHRLPASGLGRVRRAVEGDADFRRAIAAGAVPELVDDVGMLWLEGKDGWESEAADLVAARDDEAESKDLRKELKRSDKRRVAAEQAAARSRTELLARDAQISEQVAELDGLRADVTKALDEAAELRAELIDARNEARHARDRERAARSRADHEVAAPAAAPAPAPVVDDDALRHRLTEMQAQLASLTNAADLERHRADAVVAASREFIAHLDALVEEPESPAPPERATAVGGATAQRQPLALPGGVISTSAEAADFVMRSDALVLVDGYNVAKLGWPGRTLEQQREALIGRCENLARRCRTDIAVIFDGASVTGAHAPARRSVRVVFSPHGVSADDVIRAEVAALPHERHVAVVTNDREIVDDVRAAGANVVPSNAFIAVF